MPPGPSPPPPKDARVERIGTSSARPEPVDLEQIIITPELERRPKRRADDRAEAEALSHLAETMATSPDTMFQELVDSALRLCRAQGSGISLLDRENGKTVFRWRATAGTFTPLVGTTLPRDLSPCGTVVDRNALLLMADPARHFPGIAEVVSDVQEVLLAPFRHKDAPVGTLWIVAQNDATRFDAEDARILTSLSQFAAATWRALDRRSVIEANRRELQTRQQEHEQNRAELAQANATAQLNDTRFHAFFDQAPFYAGMLTTDGKVADIGRMALEACGYDREGIIGKFFWDTPWWRGLPEVQQRLRAAFESALAGRRFEAVLPYVIAAGPARWSDFRMNPVLGESGEVIFVVATGTDITDRVNGETELAAMRKRRESALLAAEIGTYEWDVLSDRLYGDPNFVRIFGVSVDEVGSAPIAAFLGAIHPDDRARVEQSIRHSVAMAANFCEDYRVFHPEHGDRWIHARGRMAKDEAGRVVSFFGVAIDITARKRAEQERELVSEHLRRLTAIHETVLSSTNDFAYVFDLQGRFLYGNRPLLALYGKRLDQLVGKTFSELGYPAWHADLHLREIAQVIATKQPIRGEVPFTGESGISGIYDYIFTPVLTADGTVEAVAGTTRDVSERKRGEDRDRLLIALDDTTRPLTDPDAITHGAARLLGDHLRVNRCAYADVEADENTFNLTGDYNRDVPSIVGRYRFDQFGDECLRLMRAGEPYVVTDSETDPRTAAVREAYRATLIRSVVCVPLQKSGRFVAAMAVHQTTPRTWLQSEIEMVRLVANQCWESIERTRVVRVLAESEQRLRLAVETGRLGVWEVDLQTRALTASVQCKAIYGQDPAAPFSFDDMLGGVHEDDATRVRDAMDRSMADHAEFDLEYRTSWPDRSVHWILVRGQTSHAGDGRPQRMIGVSLDITARKEAESEQVRLREEAVRASRAKDDFLATLSHELRTPLNPVLLVASESARDPSLAADTRAAFDLIRKNVELEARLIDDLLDLTTITRGKLTIRKEVHDVHAILGDAISAVQPDFDEKQIAVNVRLSAGKQTVYADEVRLAQVFINLLKNAVKFTPAGGTVTLETRLEPGDRIAIQLSDNGIGMTSEELSRVFGAFEQGEHAGNHGARQFGGLGLGLAIAQRLVDLHGGCIEASSPGRNAGTIFSVKLPLQVSAKNSGWTAKSSPPFPTADVSNREHRARILLIEDHEPTRKTLEQLLRRRNYAVVCAGSLGEGRARAEAGTFDLVISDVGLPDGDGTTLMRELRDRFGLKGIALTGYGMQEDIARCRAAGFLVHLTKPIRVEALDAALREFPVSAE